MRRIVTRLVLCAPLAISLLASGCVHKITPAEYHAHSLAWTDLLVMIHRAPWVEIQGDRQDYFRRMVFEKGGRLVRSGDAPTDAVPLMISVENRNRDIGGCHVIVIEIREGYNSSPIMMGEGHSCYSSVYSSSYAYADADNDAFSRALSDLHYPRSQVRY